MIVFLMCNVMINDVGCEEGVALGKVLAVKEMLQTQRQGGQTQGGKGLHLMFSWHSNLDH